MQRRCPDGARRRRRHTRQQQPQPVAMRRWQSRGSPPSPGLMHRRGCCGNCVFHPPFSIWLGNPGPCSDQSRQIRPVVRCDPSPSCRCKQDAPCLGPGIGDVALNRQAVASEQSVEFIGDERLARCCRRRSSRRRCLGCETGHRRRDDDPGDHDIKSPGYNPVGAVPELDHVPMCRRIPAFPKPPRQVSHQPQSSLELPIADTVQKRRQHRRGIPPNSTGCRSAFQRAPEENSGRETACLALSWSQMQSMKNTHIGEGQ